MFQIAELKRDQLLECHIRCYAVRHVRDAQGGVPHFQTHFMRLLHPNDEWGGVLFLALPNIVVHRVDAWSPILPTTHGDRDETEAPANSFRFPDVIRRSHDCEAGNRTPLNRGTRYPGPDSTHMYRRDNAGNVYDIAADRLRQFWQECSLEIVVIIEGLDPTTSNTVQKRHSFAGNDIVFDHKFAPCVFEDPDPDGYCLVDMRNFHDLVPVTSEEDGEDFPPPVSIS
eukprot:m.116686 g.116686  ORF g.116686 m.116686 type:complete len:227 (-) comp16081_c2_seq6:1935-2615(-)